MPSRATRRPPARSRASCRGTISARLHGQPHSRKLIFESHLELQVLHLLLARPDVVDIWDQPPSICYIDGEGRAKDHFFDFLITLQSDERFALAVKPAAIVERRAFRPELQRIREATPFDFADEVLLVTDRSFTSAEARNAERLHEFRRHPDPEADAAILDVLQSLTSERTIAECVEASRLEGRGFRAAFRALYSGAARALDMGDIQPNTRILPGGAA